MARPGTVHQLPMPITAGDAPEFAVCFALLDYEVSYAIANPGTRSPAECNALAERIALETRCQQVPLGEAAFVLSYGPLPENAWAEIRRGTLAFPDQGATIIYCIASVDASDDVRDATTMSLTGPGIETQQMFAIGGLGQSECDARNRANSDYPMGVDLILLDPRGHLVVPPPFIADHRAI